MFTRRPSVGDRTKSSPQTLRIDAPTPVRANEALSVYRHNAMTPPASPASSRYSRTSTDFSSSPDDVRREFSLRQKSPPSQRQSLRTEDGALICPYEVEILLDSRDRKQILGYGAWSNVYRGTCNAPANTHPSGLMTPPLSPGNKKRAPILVAVKQPARKDAISILRSEALILSHLMHEPGNEMYIVPFHGLMLSDSSLILEALPLSLEDYIKKCAVTANADPTTHAVTQPVVGNESTWLSLAQHLISALAWLHNEAMVVHGDIKPGNILLSSPTLDPALTHGLGLTPPPISTSPSLFPYNPVFTDFSSSQLLTSSEPTPNTLSAVTREYTAPELLSSKVLKDPTSTATTASDVFSLAVTLIAAATGNTMIYSGSVFQRQAMATQGWGIINNVRNSDDAGLRLPRRGVVEKTVESAVLKKEMGRIDAVSWKRAVESMMLE